MIREFHKDELDAVMQLWMNAITKAHPFISREHWLNKYRTVRNEHLSMAETVVYGEHGRLKGFVSILEDSFIAALFVDADNWNQGIGTKLIEWCQEKYTHLEVNVYKKSENTVHFYTKHGFTVEREQKNSDTGEQELFMTWKKD
ncbi:N-acetyltransferase [Clostridium merdae]|uniref:N-acetyltransferase n=1 Tax=Clostridium merdae TaxID=1958780 RepID=UPI000A26B1D3|nr:N-acetyltransferase [Clostridium merdae]